MNQMNGQESIWGLLLRDFPSKLVMMYSLSGELLQVSDQSQLFLGIPPFVLEGARMNVATVMHRDDVALVYKCFSDLMEADEGTTIDVFHRVVSDLGRYVELSSQFFLFSLNKVPQLFFSVSSPLAYCDPVRVNCLEELHAQSFTAQLSAAAEFISVSPAALPILGLYPSHLLGHAFQDFLCPADLAFFAERFADADANKATQSELVFSILFKTGEGEFIPVVVTLGFVPAADGSCYVCLCTIGRISSSSLAVQPAKQEAAYQASMQALPPPAPFEPPSSAPNFAFQNDFMPLVSPSSDFARTPSSSQRRPDRRASDAQIVLPSRPGNSSSDLSPSPPRSLSLDACYRPDLPLERKTAYRPSRRTDLVCEFCGKTESPEWRRGPSGSNTLCNACGIKYAKKRKVQELKNAEDVVEKSSKPRTRKPRVESSASSSSTESNGSPMKVIDMGLDRMHSEWANIAT